MSDVVIKAENLGKKYIIGHQTDNGRYVALRDVLMHGAHSIWRKTRNIFRGKPIIEGDVLEEFWALRDVSFEIRRGDVVGIIGRNGAGKSTLLKLLSRITEPSEGRIRMKGRVGSLLEVGTGFHPELTGRENIFLNGAVLGMARAEIHRSFDEIVAFAEVEKFLDTPVKRYSSGMYVRLAFSVAAHLETEILIVDEVLAVGDGDFQKKCLGKMHEASKGGRTVLFVSHNMTAIMSLCVRGILLDYGLVKFDGSARDSVQNYLSAYTGGDSFERTIARSDKLKIVSGKIVYARQAHRVGMAVELKVWSNAHRRVSFDLRISEGGGNPVGFGSLGTFRSGDLIELQSGVTMVTISFPTDFLANGTYTMSFDVTIPFQEYLDRAERCLSFDLQRPAPVGQTHVAAQHWGYGSIEIPVFLEDLISVSNPPKACSRS